MSSPTCLSLLLAGHEMLTETLPLYKLAHGRNHRPVMSQLGSSVGTGLCISCVGHIISTAHRFRAEAAKDVVAGNVRRLQQHEACNSGTSWTELEDDHELRVVNTVAAWAALRLLQVLAAVLGMFLPYLKYKRLQPLCGGRLRFYVT